MPSPPRPAVEARFACSRGVALGLALDNRGVRGTATSKPPSMREGGEGGRCPTARAWLRDPRAEQKRSLPGGRRINSERAHTRTARIPVACLSVVTCGPAASRQPREERAFGAEFIADAGRDGGGRVDGAEACGGTEDTRGCSQDGCTPQLPMHTPSQPRRPPPAGRVTARGSSSALSPPARPPRTIPLERASRPYPRHPSRSCTRPPFTPHHHARAPP